MAWKKDEENGSSRIHGTTGSDSGHARLHELGYKQELKRDLSVLSNFVFSFSIISVLTGITTLYNTGLKFGGPVATTYGWFVAGSFTMLVGMSMAEICSSYPTSGGLCYWSAKLSGKNWAPFASWMTGWFNIIGQWAATTSVDYSLAQLIQVIILLSTGGNNDGGYVASKYVIIAIHGGILLVHAIINSISITWLSFFGQLGAAWNILGVFVLMILVPTVATKTASPEFVFTHFNTENDGGIHNKFYIFVLGLLMSQYTFTGYDASVLMASDCQIPSSPSLGNYIGFYPSIFSPEPAPPRRSLTPSSGFDEVGPTGDRLYFARLALQYDDLADRYDLCLSHLRRPESEAVALSRRTCGSAPPTTSSSGA